MKKIIPIAVIILSIVFFVGLVRYGFRYSRGIPVVVEEPEIKTLEVLFLDAEIDFSKGIGLKRWDSIASGEIELMHQVMVLPWGKTLVSPVNVKAFHNGEDIYFYISWNDSTENRSFEEKIFSDSAAILFPMKEDAQPSSLMMGFLGSANAWHWKASVDREYWLNQQPQTEAYVDFYYPFEEEELFVVSKETPQSAVADLMAIRVGTITKKEKQAVTGRGFWKDGVWQVVFKRAFKHSDLEVDAIFNRGKKRLCAFAVWEGESGDRGGRKSISDWIELDIK